MSAKDKASIKAETGNVIFKAAEESSESYGVKASVGGEHATKSKTSTNDAGETTTENSSEQKKAGALSADVKTGTAKKAGSIKAGSIDIDAGKDATFTGTKMDSKGDINVNAKGDVSFEATKNTNFDASVSGKASKDENGKTQASIGKAAVGGGVTSEGASIKSSGGNVNVKSGGTIATEGTQLEGKKVTLDAKEGVDNKSAVSGGADVGMNKLGVGLKSQQTTIKQNQGQ